MIGTKLGKWIIDEELGHGGMGRVYLAHEEQEGETNVTTAGDQPVMGYAAIKVLSPELAQESGFLQRFQAEIQALSQLSHPHIVRFYDSGQHDGLYYYAMEYISGSTFDAILHERGRLPYDEVLEMASQVCPALKHAHDHGIIHRDIKPSNLIRSEDGVVKLTDFGVAKIFAGNQLTATGAIVGTAEYLSPEQAAGKPVSNRSDLYSLGVVFYALITGKPPFQGKSIIDLVHKHRFAQFDSPQLLVPELPHEFDEIICQLLEKDPAHRPADAMVLNRRLDRLRRKLERKDHVTVDNVRDATRADHYQVEEEEEKRPPGPGTLMSRMMRDEIEKQKKPGPVGKIINKPVVLVALFLVCVGVIAWHLLIRKPPSAAYLFQEAENLMSSADFAEWERAGREFLDPLDNLHPEHPYKKQVKDYRQRIADHGALRRALAGVQGEGVVAEAEGTTTIRPAERFYREGLRLCQERKIVEAHDAWQNLITAYDGSSADQRWVNLAREGVKKLKVPNAEQRKEEIRNALRPVRALLDEDKKTEAEARLRAVEGLFKENPFWAEVLAEFRNTTGKGNQNEQR